MQILSLLNTYVFGPALPIAVFSAGLFISCKLKFFHLTKPMTVIRGITGAKRDGTSPFKAMSVALAGTLGVGNIAGVAAAITAGGAGSIFWMWLSALFAMILKYAETVLAVKHRRIINENGVNRFTGGAFVYMSEGGRRHLGLLFTVLCIVTSVSMGSIVQSNAIAVSLESSFGLEPCVCGAILAFITFFVISGGFSKVSEITFYAVPLFCLLYTGISLYIIVINASRLPDVVSQIVTEA
ncbi:MAG: sodium:alanine symporter family protein, partial [Clostridia bacterium]|nr:sodium:alanine symporter family protein [Clostridia bacterium]